MFGDRLKIWADGLKAEAKIHAEILMLQRLLAKRFGDIPADTVSLISNASVEDIERWADRVFDAKQLSDIFND